MDLKMYRECANIVARSDICAFCYPGLWRVSAVFTEASGVGVWNSHFLAVHSKIQLTESLYFRIQGRAINLGYPYNVI